MTHDEIEVKKIGDYIVFLIPYNGSFFAKKGDVRLDADTLPKLEEIIKRQQANDRHFDPIDVIEVGDEKLGRITSRVADNDREVYFTFKDKPNDKPTRVAKSLEETYWGRSEDEPKHNFVKATPTNLAVRQKIKDLSIQIAELYADQKDLRATYDDPITWEVIGKQAGEDPNFTACRQCGAKVGKTASVCHSCGKDPFSGA